MDYVMKKLILAAALTLISFSAAAKDTWEYKTTKTGRLSMSQPQYLTNTLNKLGANGWELVTVQHTEKQTWLFLKRKK